ncbi:zinc ribbon domain-containing protein [Alcaligenaceae bacterium LF4-65]|uniref:Zinc ribbon domain-containing protein n=1 Tax=Zwartia hollandica TaxID=324606 RepID=A0A953N8N4_9BURK|nr:zinc ribbon domain-containing protein [Zwartia hollandica]
MPIYAYKCTACGHAEDVLRKISDKPLTVCPQCNQETYAKQVTAAGFQLKGSGWYVTDFRNNSSGGAKTAEVAPGTTAADAKPAGSESASAGSTSESGSSAAPESSSSTASTSAQSTVNAPAAPSSTPAPSSPSSSGSSSSAS